jgi:equilibrative nucleoside transporter 1/2/3
MYAIYFPRLSIVKYYRSKAALEGANTDLDDRTVADIKNIKANHEVVYCNFNLFQIYYICQWI